MKPCRRRNVAAPIGAIAVNRFLILLWLAMLASRAVAQVPMSGNTGNCETAGLSLQADPESGQFICVPTEAPLS